MTTKLIQFLKENGKDGYAERFDGFYKSLSNPGVSFDEALTKDLLANVELKHRFAKWIVEKLKADEWFSFCCSRCDTRLMCMLHYYAWVHVLNRQDLDESYLNRFLRSLANINSDFHYPYLRGVSDSISWCRGQYLSGWCLSSDFYSPVWMGQGGDFHPSYRVFSVNLLCFRDKRFFMGCRCDTGPIHPDWMLYHKGCRPIGVKTDAKGQEWTLFEIDASLTDDNTAVFSNGLDGDGTVEVCDWVNENDVRVVFRANY